MDMKNQQFNFGRRRFLTNLTAGAAFALASPACALVPSPSLPSPPASQSPVDLARNEAFWREVAGYYDRTSGIVNLEHGYWGKMAHPVQATYLDATRMVNAQNSFYARREFDDDLKKAIARIARSLGAEEDEIAITRNATESIHNLIRQYQGLGPGDAVLLADIDYPGFKSTMHWLQKGRGVEVIEIQFPERANKKQILDQYLHAFDAHPNIKLMLVTHISNQHGMVVPVAEIAAAARKRGIDIICDAAQSWGLVNYRINDLGIDWAGFNLHKWIGAPLGVGALYMRRGSLQKISPYPGEQDEQNTSVSARVHSGTTNFASTLAIPAALDFHEALGGPNKEARLRYLRSIWTDEAQKMSHIEVLGGLDESSWCGIGSFRLAGRSSIEDSSKLQLQLEKKFGIFTVVRKGLTGGGCVRITPQVFNSADEVARLVEAMESLRTA